MGGRDGPGQVLRLYEEQEYEKMLADTPAEILRVEMGSVYLQLRALGVENPMTFPLLDRPPKSNLIKAASLLCRIGALDRGTNSMTDIGKKLAVMPLPPL